MSSTTRSGSEGKTILLPPPRHESATSLEEALRKRRSHRNYRQDPLTLNEVGQLLWAAQGVTHGPGFRTAPSAGALYPLETYLVAGNVDKLPPGIYRYLPKGHKLVLLFSGDVRTRLRDAALDQEMVRTAPAGIVFTAIPDRSTVKYGRRGVRYVLMEAGAAAQNVSLQAVSLNLETVFIGAFDDGEVRQALSLPKGEDPLLILPVGKEKIQP